MLGEYVEEEEKNMLMIACYWTINTKVAEVKKIKKNTNHNKIYETHCHHRKEMC